MTFRWREAPAPSEADIVVEHVAHGDLHPADRWQPWTRGAAAARAMIDRMQRVARNQRDREEISLGYRDLGGEGGIS